MAGFLLSKTDERTNMRYADAWCEIKTFIVKFGKEIRIIGEIYNSQQDYLDGKEFICQKQMMIQPDSENWSEFEKENMRSVDKDFLTSALNVFKAYLEA